MAKQDEEGFIQYTPEELNRIPSFEVRDRQGATTFPNPSAAVGAVGGAAIGAGLGSAFGPAGTAVGGIAGAVTGGSAGEAATRAAAGKKA